MTGHLIPAWDAFGTYQVIDEHGELHTTDPSERECLLSVSAVDGKILKEQYPGELK